MPEAAIGAVAARVGADPKKVNQWISEYGPGLVGAEAPHTPVERASSVAERAADYSERARTVDEPPPPALRPGESPFSVTTETPPIVEGLAEALDSVNSDLPDGENLSPKAVGALALFVPEGSAVPATVGAARELLRMGDGVARGGEGAAAEGAAAAPAKAGGEAPAASPKSATSTEGAAPAQGKAEAETPAVALESAAPSAEGAAPGKLAGETPASMPESATQSSEGGATARRNAAAEAPAAESERAAQSDKGLATAPAAAAVEPPAAPQNTAQSAKPTTDVPGRTPAPAAPQVVPARGAIADDAARKLIEVGRPTDEARATGAVYEAHYEARAARFEGAKGTPQELYETEGPEIVSGEAAAARSEPIETESGSPRELYQPAEEVVSTGPDGRTSRFENTLRFWRGSLSKLKAGLGREVTLGKSFYVLREMGEADRGLILSPVYAKKIADAHPDIPPHVWERLPELVADPLYAFRHHEGGLDLVIDATTARGEPLIVGVRDGQVRTITPKSDLPGQSGLARLHQNMAAAIRGGETKIYAKDGRAPTGVLQALRGQFPAHAPERSSRTAVRRSRINIISRDDVIKNQGRIYYQREGATEGDLVKLPRELEQGAKERREFEQPARSEDRQRFLADLARAKSGEMARHVMVRIGGLAAALQAIGLPLKDMRIPQGVLAKLAEKHGLPEETVRRLPDLLAEPVMVFDSATELGSYVAVLAAKDAEGRPLIAAIHPATQSVPHNIVASVYGKDGAQNWLTREIAAGRLRYADETKTAAWSRDTGLQLPGWDQTTAKRKVLSRADLVKPPRKLEQGARGKITLGLGRAIITLFKHADASTFLHETGHLWLEELMRDAADPAAPASLVKDAQTVRDWLGNDGGALTREQHEQFARGFERYLMEGRAPTQALADVFAKFKQWLTTIYRRVSGLDVPISDDIRGVFDRLIAKEAQGTTVPGALKPRIPRLSEALPGRDIFGEPISNADAASAGARAQIEVDKMRNDPVRQAMLRLGVFPGMPQRTIRGVELSDKQYDDFARITGRLMKMRLDQIVRLPGFDRLSGATQRALFDDAIAGSRDAASSLIMMQNPSIITAATKAKLGSLAAAKQPDAPVARL